MGKRRLSKKGLILCLKRDSTLSILLFLFSSFTTLYKDYQKRNLEVRLELTKQELQDTQGDRDYYQGQYKKYFELSEELQNQMGVFYE